MYANKETLVFYPFVSNEQVACGAEKKMGLLCSLP